LRLPADEAIMGAMSPRRLFRRILVPYDFSPHAGRALAIAADLAGSDGELHVLHVISAALPVTGVPGEAALWFPPKELVTSERKRLEAQVAKTVGDRGPRVTCRVEIGDPFHQITSAARRADSVVMATAGRTGLAHLLIGSVAEKVVRHSPVPVLTIRPRTPRAAAPTGRSAPRRSKASRATRRR
jgi:nucleotide-binding universal stress UspA family protein